MWSASSTTVISTATEVADPSLIKSVSLPGVATTTSAPRRKRVHLPGQGRPP